MFYFTADTHFGHANIIKHCKRPFKDTIEMNYQIIKNINAAVKPEDTLFILGDVAFEKKVLFESMAEIKCKKVLLVGNHDNWRTFNVLQQEKLIESYHDTLMVKYNGISIWLSHYPHLAWDKQIYGAYHLYGHVHGRFANEPNKNGLSMDVGVDCNNYCPLSFFQINDKMKQIIEYRKALEKELEL